MSKIVFPAHRVKLSEKAIDAAKSVMESGWITTGSQVEALEDHWKDRTGNRYGVAFGSGQAALNFAVKHFVDRVRSIKDKQPRVGVQGNAFIGDLAAIYLSGAEPVFIDIDPHDKQIASEDVIKAYIDVLLVTHIGGSISRNISNIALSCKNRNIFLVEDACQAHGSLAHGKEAGSFGDIAVFSFYATKMVSAGEGGMLVTSDLRASVDAKRWRNNGSGSVFRDDAILLAPDSRMSDILGAVALEESIALEDKLLEHKKVSMVYYGVLKSADGEIENLDIFWDFMFSDTTSSNLYKFCVYTENAAILEKALLDHGIQCSSPVYEIPVYAHTAYPDNAHRVFLPVTERYAPQQVCLPIYPMSDDELGDLKTLFTDALYDYAVKVGLQ